VRLKYAASSTNVAGDMHPDFMAIVSAADLAGAQAEGAKVVASLNGQVEVIGIEEGATRQSRL
jgi:hypothetical protein